jgi:hypothetical protein
MTANGWQVVFFVLYLIALFLFLTDAVCRLSSRVTWNSTWMTPLGLFFAFLPAAIATGRTIG